VRVCAQLRVIGVEQQAGVFSPHPKDGSPRCGARASPAGRRLPSADQ
jgi:hypothetical protein